MLRAPRQTRFKRRLFLTALGLLLIMVLTVTAGLVALQQHGLFLERSVAAHRVYASYRSVSDHTYRKLSSIADIAITGSDRDSDARQRNQAALQSALLDVRDYIDAESKLYPEGSAATALQLFDEIEFLAGEIVRYSVLVRRAAARLDQQAAIEALESLRSPEIEGAFDSRIDRALAEQLRHVQDTGEQAAELSAKITGFAPFLVLLLTSIGALLMITTWRALSQSLRAFNDAISAYREGNFSHRIERVGEAEFSALAVAFNRMAAEVATQRERERKSQENLEMQIGLRTQELERSNQQLATISERRKRFLADISHELRTPLTIIRGEADVALRGDTKTIEQYKDALLRVREQSIHTARLVQDLLFVARTEDGQAPLHLRAEAMVPLVKEVCEELRRLAQDRAIEIDESYGDAGLVAAVDAGRIKQVITILIDNAIKYSNENSTVKVSLYAVGNFVEMSVTDTGIGLSAEQSANAFTRYYRGNDSANAPVGTGLGLPVAKAIVEAHRGQIALDGEQGYGTTATVLLPLETQFKAVS